MARFKTFTAMLLAASALLTAAALAQGSGRWTTGTPMPSARTEIAVAEASAKIYVVGGFRGERELEIYDPSADRWSRGASIPRALHHAAAVGLNGASSANRGQLLASAPYRRLVPEVYATSAHRWHFSAFAR